MRKYSIISILLGTLMLVQLNSSPSASTIVYWEMTDANTTMYGYEMGVAYNNITDEIILVKGAIARLYSPSFVQIGPSYSTYQYIAPTTYNPVTFDDYPIAFYSVTKNETYLLDNFRVWKYLGLFDNSGNTETAWFGLTPYTMSFPDTTTRLDSPRAVYDEINDVIILFGGNYGTSYLGNTWLFNFTTSEWHLMTPAIAPGPRRSHAMVYNSNDGLVYLFGGRLGSSGLYNDMWVYNVANNTWTEITTVNPTHAREDHRMIYDTINKKILMYGGRYYVEGQAIAAPELWAYDVYHNIWTYISGQGGPIASSTGAWIMVDDKRVVHHDDFYSLTLSLEITYPPPITTNTETITETITEVYQETNVINQTNQIIVTNEIDQTLVTTETHYETDYDEITVYTTGTIPASTTTETETKTKESPLSIIYPIFGLILLVIEVKRRRK